MACQTERTSTAADVVTLRTPRRHPAELTFLEMLKRNFKQTLFSRRSKISLSGDHVKATRAVTQAWIELVNSCLFSQQVTPTGRGQPLTFLCVGSFSRSVKEGTVCRPGKWQFRRFSYIGKICTFVFLLVKNKNNNKNKKLAGSYFKSTDFQMQPDPKVESGASPWRN